MKMMVVFQLFSLHTIYWCSFSSHTHSARYVSHFPNALNEHHRMTIQMLCTMCIKYSARVCDDKRDQNA